MNFFHLLSDNLGACGACFFEKHLLPIKYNNTRIVLLYNRYMNGCGVDSDNSSGMFPVNEGGPQLFSVPNEYTLIGGRHPYRHQECRPVNTRCLHCFGIEDTQAGHWAANCPVPRPLGSICYGCWLPVRPYHENIALGRYCPNRWVKLAAFFCFLLREDEEETFQHWIRARGQTNQVTGRALLFDEVENILRLNR